MKVKSFSYKKGISLPKIKSLNLSEEAAEKLPAKDKIFVPVRQVKGMTPQPVVIKGDKVSVGSVLARVGDNVVYAPVSGIVEEVVSMPSVYGGVCNTIVINNDGKNTTKPWFTSQEYYSKEELINNIKIAKNLGRFLSPFAVLHYLSLTLLHK